MIYNIGWNINTTSVILSLDIIITPYPHGTNMKRQAMQTAMALYEGGTLDLQTAASQAGVSPERLSRAVRRAGLSPPSAAAETDRIAVNAD